MQHRTCYVGQESIVSRDWSQTIYSKRNKVDKHRSSEALTKCVSAYTTEHVRAYEYESPIMESDPRSKDPFLNFCRTKCCKSCHRSCVEAATNEGTMDAALQVLHRPSLGCFESEPQQTSWIWTVFHLWPWQQFFLPFYLETYYWLNASTLWKSRWWQILFTICPYPTTVRESSWSFKRRKLTKTYKLCNPA